MTPLIVTVPVEVVIVLVPPLPAVMPPESISVPLEELVISRELIRLSATEMVSFAVLTDLLICAFALLEVLSSVRTDALVEEIVYELNALVPSPILRMPKVRLESRFTVFPDVARLNVKFPVAPMPSAIALLAQLVARLQSPFALTFHEPSVAKALVASMSATAPIKIVEPLLLIPFFIKLISR